MVTIISTHPVTTQYVKWQIDEVQHIQTPVWDYTIPGGSGVVNKNTLAVPQGVATQISEEDLDRLMTLESFKKDIKDGFIKVLKGKRAASVDADEEAEKDMNTEGSGKQITSAELEKDGAVINDDGSIDVTEGGQNAAAMHAKQGELSQNGMTIEIPQKRGGRRSKKQSK